MEKNWKKILSEQEYYVTREKGTERPFTGEYNDFFEQGHYYCKCCESKLFSSNDKFQSHCGWPSFSDQLHNDNLKFVQDLSHNMVRTEVLCAQCDAHLGHVFEDGPTETKERYCINSVSLIFKKD